MNCDLCGFTISWHYVSDPRAKSPKAWCPARTFEATLETKSVPNPMYSFRRRYSTPQYLRIPTKTETVWVPVLAGRQGPESPNLSGAPAAEMIQVLHSLEEVAA